VPVAEREDLILRHLPQVRLIARKIHERLPETVGFEDLVSVGIIGLIHAIDHFDPAQNVKLRTYAEFRIRGAILDSLRDADWAPRMKRRLARELQEAVARAEHRLRRTPEEAEIAAELGVSLDEYHARLTEIAALDVGELEYLRDEYDAPVLLKYIAAPDDDSPAIQLERSELERLISTCLDGIPRIERTVLGLYFHEELTLKEIGEIVGMHYSRVSQIKSQAILRLRNALARRWPGARV
jgi:RNA polymerase sigma factor for flagellar operon FliA